MDQRDIEKMAEDAARRVLGEAVDRIGLTKDGKPDWQLMANLVTSWKKREDWKLFVLKAAATAITGLVIVWLSGILRLSELLNFRGGPQ